MATATPHPPAPAWLLGRRFRAVVVGASAGGLDALGRMLGAMGRGVSAPVLVVQHLAREDRGRFAAHLDEVLDLTVREAEDKLAPMPGRVYIAPADYHLLVERSGALALSVDPKVNWSRPSVDPLFETAARAHGAALLAVVLTGANADGAQGARVVRELGGVCMAQDPRTAESPIMPGAAIEAAGIETILPPEEIGALLAGLRYSPGERQSQGGVVEESK